MFHTTTINGDAEKLLKVLSLSQVSHSNRLAISSWKVESWFVPFELTQELPVNFFHFTLFSTSDLSGCYLGLKNET